MPLFTPDFEKVLTILFFGPRSAGKSLHQAKRSIKIMKYLTALYRRNKKLPRSIILSNQKFSKKIEEKYQRYADTGEQLLFYWENFRQLRWCPRENCWRGKERHRLHGAYIIFDDIATIIPADGWKDLPVWFRKMFAQAGHQGIHCLANIQDPMSCDINFRRYVDVAYKFRKLMGSARPEETKPPIKVIWGFYSTHKVSADKLFKDGDIPYEQIELIKEKEKKLGIRSGEWKYALHWIGRKASEYYDTLQDIPEYMPDTLEHIEKRCQHPGCRMVHVTHRAI